jgi:cell division protein FtsL
MSDNSPATVDELRSSLVTFHELRRSALTAIILMLIGAVIIVGSFIYSFTKLRPLERQIFQTERQIAQNQEEIQQKTTDLNRLKDEIVNANKDLEDTNHRLEIARESLKKIAAGTENPRLQAQQALSTVSNASKSANALDGTTWDYQMGNTHYVIEFLANGKYHYTNDRRQSFDGFWSQTGNVVRVVTSNGAERETGFIKGNRIEGTGIEETGTKYTWTATKR